MNTRRRFLRFHPRTALEICYELAAGKTLTAICADITRPTMGTFLKWVSRHPTLQARYELALEMRAEVKAAEVEDIADQVPPASVSVIDGKTIERIDVSWVRRQQLRIDARKWAAATMKPKKYGSRVALTDGEGKPLATAPPIINIGFELGGPGSDPTSEPDPSAEG